VLSTLTVFGTRPEAIKLAPVLLALQAHGDWARSRVCVTAQHREMLDQVLDLFRIVPDVDLDLMQPGQSLGALTARVLEGVGAVLDAERPDVVLVQGDTTTVMAAALAAYYRRVPVGHVEAGLRSGDRDSPFPEEVNRRVAGLLADHHFCPTDTARRALLREGVPERAIHVTGNTVIDALYAIVRRPPSPEAQALLHACGCNGSAQAPGPDTRTPHRGNGHKLVLVTAHRRENHAHIDAICAGLRALAERNPDVHLLYPVHLNPRVHGPAHRVLGGVERVHLVPPVTYDVMAHLVRAATLVLTDSGGLQEEAPTLGVPVLVMRDETERPEAIEAGTARLVGHDPDRIVAEAERLLRDAAAHAAMANAVSPYGDGHAAERIVAVLRGLQ
jgi:UDP-N-acetylglucosamine 2-epimerase (non-hydrolysing)